MIYALSTAMTSNIPVKFINADFYAENISVAVFTKNFSMEATSCVAWEVLHAQPEQIAEFVYPLATQSIGAVFQKDICRAYSMYRPEGTNYNVAYSTCIYD